MTQQQSTEMVRATPAQELVVRIREDDFQAQLAMALPENVPASRFVRAAATALMADPKIAQGVDIDSFFVALMRSAQAGLLPDNREAAIVRYGDKAQFLPMIGGIRKTGAEFGWTIDTKVVRDGDEFEYEAGMEPRLTHRPALGERGDLRFAYAIARHRDGRREVEVMDAADIAKVQAKSKQGSSGAWKEWPERMWEKSVGHRIFKRLPLDPGDKRVAMIVDAEVIGPAAAANMLYGPRDEPLGQVREIGSGDTPGGGNAPADDGGAREASAVDQQAAAKPSSGTEPPAPAAAPGFSVPDAVIDEAAAFPVVHNDPDSGWNGLLVGKIIAERDGAAWLGWACGDGGEANLSAETVANVRLYVEHRQASIWEAVNAK